MSAAAGGPRKLPSVVRRTLWRRWWSIGDGRRKVDAGIEIEPNEVVAGRRVADDIIRVGPITARQLLCRPF